MIKKRYGASKQKEKTSESEKCSLPGELAHYFYIINSMVNIRLKLSVLTIKVTRQNFLKCYCSHSHTYTIGYIQKIEPSQVCQYPYGSEYDCPFSHNQPILLKNVLLRKSTNFQFHQIVEIGINVRQVHEQSSMDQSDDTIFQIFRKLRSANGNNFLLFSGQRKLQFGKRRKRHLANSSKHFKFNNYIKSHKPYLNQSLSIFFYFMLIKFIMAQEKSSPTFLKRSLLNGLSGSFAVAVQTVSLTWFHTILDESKKTGHSLKSTTQNLYQNGGVPRFYKGFLPAFRSASLARFGDNSTNAFVLNHFASRNNLQNTSLAIQSAIIWVIASTWRLAIMPFDALDLRSRKEMFELNFKVIGEFKKNLKRIYLKRTRPQILSLYFWFSTQNYLSYYLPLIQYKKSLLFAFLRNGFIGFCSMICFDIVLAGYRRFKHITAVQNKYGILLGQSGRTVLKGCHGIVFCSSSMFIKQKFQSASNKS